MRAMRSRTQKRQRGLYSAQIHQLSVRFPPLRRQLSPSSLARPLKTQSLVRERTVITSGRAKSRPRGAFIEQERSPGLDQATLLDIPAGTHAADLASSKFQVCLYRVEFSHSQGQKPNPPLGPLCQLPPAADMQSMSLMCEKCQERRQSDCCACLRQRPEEP